MSMIEKFSFDFVIGWLKGVMSWLYSISPFILRPKYEWVYEVNFQWRLDRKKKIVKGPFCNCCEKPCHLYPSFGRMEFKCSKTGTTYEYQVKKIPSVKEKISKKYFTE
jgi:hypothetical protein